jgi:hypothetical protein
MMSYASITSNRPNLQLQDAVCGANEFDVILFEGVLKPLGDANLPSDAVLAIIRIEECVGHHDVVQRQFFVELDANLRLSLHKVLQLIYNIVPMKGHRATMPTNLTQGQSVPKVPTPHSL